MPWRKLQRLSSKGNSDAPYPSLPNYLWLEAGTNFGILDDNPPSANSQTTTSHLVTFLTSANVPSWKAYEEDNLAEGRKALIK